MSQIWTFFWRFTIFNLDENVEKHSMHNLYSISLKFIDETLEEMPAVFIEFNINTPEILFLEMTEYFLSFTLSSFSTLLCKCRKSSEASRTTVDKNSQKCSWRDNIAGKVLNLHVSDLTRVKSLSSHMVFQTLSRVIPEDRTSCKYWAPWGVASPNKQTKQNNPHRKSEMWGKVCLGGGPNYIYWFKIVANKYIWFLSSRHSISITGLDEYKMNVSFKYLEEKSSESWGFQ